MPPFPLKGDQTGPRKHMHRLLQKRTIEASTLTSTTPPLFGTVSAPSSTAVSTTTSTTPPLFRTVSATLFTTASTPPVTPTSYTPPQVGTISAPSFSTSTTPAPSPTPSSTPAPSSPIVNEQEDIRVDERLHIQVEGMELEPSGKCAYIMRKSFIDRVDSNGYKWVTLSKETKQFYWEEFQKKCQWDVSDGASVKIAWEHKAKERYRQYIYNMSSRTRNPTLQKPSHIEEHVWTAWNVVWNSEDFKKKSEQNKRNRRKGVEGGKAPPTHNGGSATHHQIAIDMEKCMGKPPSCYDVFMFTHTKDHDGKSLIDERSKKIHEYYESQRANLEVQGDEVDDVELFYKAVGGHDRKKRIYGLGSYGRSMFAGMSSEKCTPPDTNPQHLKSKIQKLEATVEEQQMELSDMRSTVNDLRSMIEK